MSTFEHKVLKSLQAIQINQISISSCNRTDNQDKRRALIPHTHPQMELIYFLNGDSHLSLKGDASQRPDNERINASIYDLSVAFPHLSHLESLTLGRQQETISVFLDVNYISESEAACFKLSDLNGDFRWLFEHLHMEYALNTPLGALLAQNYAQCILHMLIQHFSAIGSIDNHKAFPKVLAYIRRNLAHDITPAQLAARYDVSPSYLYRLFQQNIHMTPITYLNCMRTEAAWQMLQHTRFSIADVARAVGFKDNCYFYRAFHKYMGCTPAECRAAGSVCSASSARLILPTISAADIRLSCD